MQFSTQSSRINDSPNDLVYASDPRFSSSPRPSSIASTTLDDILLPGDTVQEGGLLQAEPIRRVSLTRTSLDETDCSGGSHSAFQVVRRLGTGSYAVVYLVREILSSASSPSSDEDGSILGSMDLGGSPVQSRPQSAVYGREFAIKCLSKANLDEDQLSAQMSEVKIHQSLHSHPNIVTLHRTLETDSYLLLLLEYVPGEDLFYFLEQSRDHVDTSALSDDFASIASNTPPTPSLLSNLNPAQLLSRTRLRLVASMFAQMCDAVAAAHDQGVYHRDIKPENFIVTDGIVDRPDGSRERKVFVKLTDFGLSTTDRDSADMDCGSAPYMSYECRNNVAPSYRTDAADVWSLGIVLINMLYHHNPWTDTSQGACTSFSLFQSAPVKFFLTRFAGMNRPVAEFLANKVFCILEDGNGPTGASRVSAHELGLWVHGLPDLLAGPPAEAINKRHQRVLSTASIDHPVSSSSQVSHRPCSRNPSGSTPATRTPAIRSRSVSRAPSSVAIGASYDRQDVSELSTVIDQDIEESQEHLPLPDDILEIAPLEAVSPDDSPSPSRSTSVNRRRKRGRKGKGSLQGSTTASPTPTTSDLLAQASQSLARELSNSRASSIISGTSGRSRRNGLAAEPVSLFPVPMAMLSSNPMSPPPLPALVTSIGRIEPSAVSPRATPSSSPSVPTKKPSKWKLSIGKSKGSTMASSPAAVEESTPPLPPTPPSAFVAKTEQPAPLAIGSSMSATASNVSSLLMGLNAPPAGNTLSSSDASWARGRRNRGSPGPANRGPPSRSPAESRSRTRGHLIPPSQPVPPLPTSSNTMFSSPNHSSENWAAFETNRGRSPHSFRSGKTPSVASSSASSNWRSSMSTTSSGFTSSSAFTSYSNNSMRSVSTAATSVSGHSWRQKDNASINSGNSGHSSRYHASHPNIPRNIKIMTGVPEELVTLPRDVNGPATARKQRTRKPKDLQLGTITERPGLSSPDGPKSPSSFVDDEVNNSPPGDGKAKNGQINALAKLLSGLHRNRN